jgi:hypothetical protein
MTDSEWIWRRVGPAHTDVGLGVSIAEFNQIAFQVRDGEAMPEGARLLMKLFCESVEQGAIPDRLIMYVRDGFRRHLDTGCSINAALGLARKKGAPKISDQRGIELAAAVLRARLAGESHQEALEIAADKCGSNKTTAGKAWGKHRIAAVAVMRNERPEGFSEDEKRKLEGILKRRRAC